jgi:hypothetical protein
MLSRRDTSEGIAACYRAEAARRRQGSEQLANIKGTQSAADASSCDLRGLVRVAPSEKGTGRGPWAP